MVKITRILKKGTPHTKGLRSKKDCFIFIDMNGSTVTRVRVINYLNENVIFHVDTDSGRLLWGTVPSYGNATESIHTKLYHSNWLEVTVEYAETRGVIEKKRVTL